MPFSFLNPWLLLGALAVAAPLWLHLRRRQETNLLYFSAVRFLDDEPRPRQSPLRIRHILLFLLRALALLLIISAFALKISEIALSALGPATSSRRRASATWIPSST